MPATLPKAERLCGRTAIGTLMSKGKWERTAHLRCCYLSGNGLEFSRLMVSVPKRWFKRAVKRNLLKRRMREAYRLQKELLGPGFDILFNYNAQEIADFETIRSEVAGILGKIASK
ncbi:MAG: ribonuclease P protein component [Bacteroidales bacterium]|nr:ribonuclease P protein component [Bacteroidales bacterium]MBO4566773.1 ribonuclease P protein component [Bacteroidales bacterium]